MRYTSNPYYFCYSASCKICKKFDKHVIWFLSFEKPEVPVLLLCKTNGTIGSVVLIYQYKGGRTRERESNCISDWSLVLNLLVTFFSSYDIVAQRTRFFFPDKERFFSDIAMLRCLDEYCPETRNISYLVHREQFFIVNVVTPTVSKCKTILLSIMGEKMYRILKDLRALQKLRKSLMRKLNIWWENISNQNTSL